MHLKKTPSSSLFYNRLLSNSQFVSKKEKKSKKVQSTTKNLNEKLQLKLSLKISVHPFLCRAKKTKERENPIEGNGGKIQVQTKLLIFMNIKKKLEIRN